jgi:hypothetical protein
MKKLIIVLSCLAISLSGMTQVSKTLTLTTPGSLTTTLTTNEKLTVTNLTLSGNIDARDFLCLRDEMIVLESLNISGASIKGYSGKVLSSSSDYYSANEIPSYSFYSSKPYKYDDGEGFVEYSKTELKSLILPPNITAIRSNAFRGCKGLTNITLPNSINNIDGDAFYGCTGLKSINIPTSLMTLSNGVFYGCTALTSITIPGSVFLIDRNAFGGCTSLMSFVVSSSNPTYSSQDGLLLNKAKTKLIQYPNGLATITIPTTITSIENYAFAGFFAPKINCMLATPPSVTISNMGFSGAVVYVPEGKVDAYKTAWGSSANVLIIEKDVDATVNVTEAGKLATTILNQLGVHPATLTKLKVTGPINAADILYIRDNMKQCYDVDLEGTDLTDLPTEAFRDKALLLNIKLPSGLKTVGNSAFYGCLTTNSITFPANITTIGTGTFSSSSISTVNFTGNVGSIGNQAFLRCASLKIVNFGGSVGAIGDGAFSGCYQLSSVNFNDTVGPIGNSAFYGCRALSTINFAKSVPSIGVNAFNKCKSLTSIVITGELTALNSGVFYGCLSLKSISLPNTITTIGSSAFIGCESLVNFKIPTEVSSIGSSAFKDCYNLTSINISAIVTSIGDYAFEGCTKVSEITSYRLTPPSLGANAFSGINTQTCKLRILKEADFDAYFNAPQWGSFLNIERITGLKDVAQLNSDNDFIKLNSNELIINTLQPCQVELYDIFGRLLFQQNSNGGRLTIPQYNAKIRIVKVSTDGKNYVKKFVN